MRFANSGTAGDAPHLQAEIGSGAAAECTELMAVGRPGLEPGRPRTTGPVDATARRNRLLLRSSEALAAAATTADVLRIVPRLMRDMLAAAHVRLVLAGTRPDDRPAATSAMSAALTRAAIVDQHARFYASAIELTVAHPALATELSRVGWQSVVCSPLPGPAGALLLAWDDPQTFYVADRAFIAALVHHIAEALRRVAENDARTAMTETLRRAMLAPPSDVGDWDLAARYLPADTVQRIGGDWYDAFAGPRGRLTLVIGDVAGHDIAAAARMSQLRSMLLAYLVDRHEAPSALIRRLDLANHTLGEPATATAIVAFLDRTSAGGYRLRWSNAGHPPPIVIGPDGEPRPLSGTDVLLGVRRSAPRHTYTCLPAAGSTVLLHTDGLVERRGQNIDGGFARLHRRLRTAGARSPRDLLTRVADIIDHRSDDITMVAVRIPG